MSGQPHRTAPGARIDLPALLPAALRPDPDGAGPDRTGRHPRTVRDWLVDEKCVVVAVGYGALMLRVGDATAPRPAIPWPVDAAIGTVCCLALWCRRRWPLGLALALTPFGAVSVMATGAATITVFTVAVHRRAPAALLVGAVNVVTGPIYFLLQPDPRFPVWVDIVARLTMTTAAVGWGMFARARRQLVLSLRERAARLAAEQHLRVDQARLTERTRIAREMHDVLAHRLSLVSLHAGALEVRTDARPEEVSTAAAVIRANAHEALQELRAVIGVLRENTSAGPQRPQPGLADVPDLIDSVRGTGMRVRYTCRVGAAGPSTVLGRTVYRIVQEGLTNARKHACGADVEVRVDEAGGGLRVRITNPAPPAGGPADVPGAGLGLVGLSERVALAGGRVGYGPDPGGDGFRLEAWLPWSGPGPGS